jgi:hypothetical protein
VEACAVRSAEAEDTDAADTDAAEAEESDDEEAEATEAETEARLAAWAEELDAATEACDIEACRIMDDADAAAEEDAEASISACVTKLNKVLWLRRLALTG